MPKLKDWQLPTDGKTSAACTLCPPFPFCFVDLFIFGFHTKESLLSSEARRDLDIIWRRQWMRGTSLGQDPPGMLQAAWLSRMPGMAQGSQWHEPPTLNKRLAVVPSLDPVSSWGIWSFDRGEPRGHDQLQTCHIERISPIRMFCDDFSFIFHYPECGIFWVKAFIYHSAHTSNADKISVLW